MSARFVTLLCCALTLDARYVPRAAPTLDNGLARTPPMGWNSWNHFHCDVSAQLIKETADALVASGMRDAGYRYVVIDDCWQVARDRTGRLVADTARFPEGLQTVIATSWRAIGLTGPARVRDLWAHSDLGAFTGRFSATVPAHGVVMVRITPVTGS